FRKTRGEQGEFSFLGFTMSGKGYPLFLFSGIVFLLFSYEAQDSLDKVKTLTKENKEVAGTALDLNRKVSQLEDANRALVTKLPIDQREEVKKISPHILAATRLSLPPSQVEKLQKVINAPSN